MILERGVHAPRLNRSAPAGDMSVLKALTRPRACSSRACSHPLRRVDAREVEAARHDPLRRAHEREAGEGATVNAQPRKRLAPEERELIKRLAEFPQVVREATARRGPHAIPVYAIRVADDFHRFYHEHRVLESDAQEFRLGLVLATKGVVARCLHLAGVDAPERM